MCIRDRGIGVGLESAPYFPMGIVFGGCQSGLNFCWVVGIVIQDGNAVHFPLVFKSTVRSLKVHQTGFNMLHRYSQFSGGCNGGKRVGNIVQAGDIQRDMVQLLPVHI